MKTLNCSIFSENIETSTWSLEGFEKHIGSNKYLPSHLLSNEENELTCVYHVKRKPSFYVINIRLPLLFLAIINPFAFIIPGSSGEKISFSMTLFLTFAVFITIVMDELPVNSDRISYLQLYLVSQIAITVVNLITIVIQVRLEAVIRKCRSSTSEVCPLEMEKVKKVLVELGESLPSSVDCPETIMQRKENNTSNIVSKIDAVAFVTMTLLQVICNGWFYASVL